jgi:hypothetical protein
MTTTTPNGITHMIDTTQVRSETVKPAAGVDDPDTPCEKVRPMTTRPASVTPHCMCQRQSDPSEMVALCRQVAQYYYQHEGVLAYAMFDHINATLFDGALPVPLITWGVTAFGGCLGSTSTSRHAPPTILLHTSVLGTHAGSRSRKADPWRVATTHLGVRYAYDVLVHECLHVSVHYCLGGATGKTSHDNPQWVREVNRLLPVLGFPRLTAGMQRQRRVGGVRIRQADGDVPYGAIARFPHALRRHLGQDAAYYSDKRLPWPLALPAATWQWLHECGLVTNSCV